MGAGPHWWAKRKSSVSQMWYIPDISKDFKYWMCTFPQIHRDSEFSSKAHLFCVCLPSRLMPKARHFCRRQCWQRFRLVRSIRQFLWREHEYMALFCWLRRKNPCTGTQNHTAQFKYSWQSWVKLFVVLLSSPSSHLAAFTGDDAVVNSWGLVPTDLTGDDLDLSCRTKTTLNQQMKSLNSDKTKGKKRGGNPSHVLSGKKCIFRWHTEVHSSPYLAAFHPRRTAVWGCTSLSFLSPENTCFSFSFAKPCSLTLLIL